MSLRLTAILPNFNHVKFLPAALESVIAQKRPADELVIVDDASTDHSATVIDKYLPRLPNAHFVRNATNIGAVAILNREIAACSSEIVVSVNADDVIYPNFFATGMAMFERYPQAGVFSAAAEYLNSEGESLGALPMPHVLDAPGFISPSSATRRLIDDYSWFFGPASLYRRTPLLAAGGFPANLRSFNDLYAAQHLAIRCGALFSPEILAGWRRLPGGMAWKDTADLSNCLIAIGRVGRQIAEASDLFPPGYAKRWTGRYRYAAYRLHRSARRNALVHPIARRAAAWRDAIVSIGYFAFLRPLDLPIAIRRLWLRRFVEDGP